MNKVIFVALAAALALTITAVGARAGRRTAQSVVVGSDYAYGSLGTARNSADSLQQIGCDLMHSSSSSALCTARSSAGVWKSCTTSDPAMLDVLRGLNGDSNLYFTVDGGRCTFVRVYTGSIYEPK